MKIITPVDHLEEVPRLLDAGADEFYGGIASAAWRGRFGPLVSINQRTFEAAQIDSLDEFEKIVSLTALHGKPFWLTLNAAYYQDDQIELIVEMVREAVEAGISGLILADIGLIRVLGSEFPGLALHASTMAHLSNSFAVREYVALGCRRVVLERHLTLDEIGTIAREVPEADLEVFLLVGRCPNTEGLCSFHHASPDRIWPCEIPYEITPLLEPATEQLGEAIARQSSWPHTDRRHGCGLCAIYHLQKFPVRALKLVGRGAPTVQKVANVLLAREFLALAGRNQDETVYRALARQAYLRRFGHACSPNVCYFPELYASE